MRRSVPSFSLVLVTLVAGVLTAPSALAAAQAYSCPEGSYQVTGVSDGGPTSTVTGDTDRISLTVANTPSQSDYKAQYGHIGNVVIDSSHVQMTTGATQDFGSGDAIVVVPSPIERIDVCGHAVASVTSLTLNATTIEITAGNRPVLSGNVSVSGNSGDVAGRAIALYAKSWGQSSYQIVANTISGGDGSYRFTVAPTTQTAYVARSGDTGSPTRVIYVHQRINIGQPAANSTFAAGSLVTFTGTTFPARPGLQIGLAYATGGYRYLAQGTANAQGAWSISTRALQNSGAYVVYCSAQNGTLYGSKSIYLNVVRPIH